MRFPLKQQVSAPIQESTHKARNQSEPDDMFEEKVNFWSNFIRENNMVKERDLLDELVTLTNYARQEYDSLYPED